MNRIKFPLQPQSQGDAVADLQEGLQLLLKKQVLQVTGTAPAGLEDRLRVEQTQRVYGQSTRLVVSVFQAFSEQPSTFCAVAGFCAIAGSENASIAAAKIALFIVPPLGSARTWA